MEHKDHSQSCSEHLSAESVSRTNGRCSKRKLVLHFDIRNTLIVSDSVTKISVEQAINAYLARVVWGKETKNGSWEWMFPSPAIHQPAEGAMTYYKFLEKKIVREPVDRVTTLRHALGDLIDTPRGKLFEEYHRSCLKGLQWNLPPEPKLTVQGRGGKSYHYILPAFYTLLQHLTATGRDFSIIIRTFGLHCAEVLDSISKSFCGKHPYFPNLSPLPIVMEPGHIRRTGEDIVLSFPNSSGETTSERAIYEYFNSCDGISGIVDDFHHWQNNDFYYKSAKPHWIDLLDEDTHHIMIDDNYRPDDNDSIVNTRLLEEDSAASLSKEEAKQFNGACMVTMDLIKCLQDPDYFVKEVQACESKYEGIVGRSAGACD